jgi:hypothetical protein
MVVISHQAIGENFYIPQSMGFAKGMKECSIVIMLLEGPLPCCAAVHDMIDGSGILDS